MAGNPLQYISRTFKTLLSDINSDPNLVDKPEWIKRLIAGLGDIDSMWNNASANQGFLRTAFTRQAVKDLLEQIDYQLTAQTTSNGTAIFYLISSISFPQTFNQDELTALSEGSVALSSKKFAVRSGHTASSTTGTFTHANPNNYLTVGTDFVVTGHKVRFTTSGALPTGLSLSTDYYLVRLSATTVSVATSLANALAGTYIDLTAAGSGSGTHTWNLYSFAMTMYQEEQKEDITVGESDGVTEFQVFDLPDSLILHDTIEITVGVDAYTKVDSLVESTAIDKHFKGLVKSQGGTAIMFGNNTYGILPPANTITASYSLGGGNNSNVTTLNKINIYTGGNTNINVVANVTAFTGGADEQTLEVAKVLGPLLLKARSRFITTEDGESLAFAQGGLAYIKINKNAFGPLSCQVIAIAIGGGNPSSLVQSTIEDYLISISVLEEMDVRFEDCTLTPVTVTSGTHVLPDFLYASILPYLTLAWKLFVSETGKEIVDTYNQLGISDAIDNINTIFGTTFTDDDDSTQIIQIIRQLEIFGYRAFGDVIQEDDAIGFIRSAVDGIDYITITLPSFPLTQDDDEILTHTGSTFNLSEIV